MILDSLGAQVVRQLRHLLGHGEEDVLGVSSSYILNFNCFLHCCTILIISCMQEHFRLVEGISEEMANILFNKTTCKVVKDVGKHVGWYLLHCTTRKC
jgi:hypothetical protein